MYYEVKGENIFSIIFKIYHFKVGITMNHDIVQII